MATASTDSVTPGNIYTIASVQVTIVKNKTQSKETKMATEEQIRVILNGLFDFPGCPECGTRMRFGDYECPKCGADLDDDLRSWAEKLVDEITK